MTVRNGREFLAIPGPTNVPDAVLAAMHRPAVDIYSGDLVDVTYSLLDDLKTIFATEGNAYIYASNGHGAWQAAISNVLSRGDKVLVLESGRFAVGWGQMAKTLGVEIEILPGDWRRAVEPGAVERRLKEDTTGEIKAVMVVQVDTASSAVNDIPAIREAMDAAGHGALLMVDTIASLATMPFEMDGWGVDVAVSGSQKGLMVPPGLGFVAANDKARAAHQNADLRSSYWDWTAREGSEHYMVYCGTPPEHLLFGLRKAVDMLLEEGLPAVFRRHALLAQATRAAVSRWARGGGVDFNILAEEERANSVTCVRVVGDWRPQDLLDFCRETCGVTVGQGIGGLSEEAFRIAHMGHVNAPMVYGTLGVIETGLAALGIPHGHGGIQAAVNSLAGALAP